MAATISLKERGLADQLFEVFQHFDGLYNSAAEARLYHIAGAEVAIRSDNSDYLEVCDRALARGGDSHRAKAKFLISHADAENCPRLIWGDAFFREREVESSLRDSQFTLHYFSEIGFWQLYDRQTARGWQIAAHKGAYPAWDAGSPLRNLLQWHLSAQIGSLIHAGTLAHRGKGALLAGAGGSGKSGTVLAGMLRGLATVGDDYVFIDDSGKHAFPLFDTLKQDGNGIARLGLADNKAISKQTNWQGKHQFYLSDLVGIDRPFAMEMVAVLLPKISGDTRSVITPISSKEAFLALAPSGISQIPGDRRVQMRVAAKILRQLPSFRMQLGSDPNEIIDVLINFLAGF